MAVVRASARPSPGADHRRLLRSGLLHHLRHRLGLLLLRPHHQAASPTLRAIGLITRSPAIRRHTGHATGLIRRLHAPPQDPVKIVIEYARLPPIEQRAAVAPPLRAARRRLGPPSGLERAFSGAYVADGLKPLHRLAHCSYVVPSDRSAATRGLPRRPRAPTSQATTASLPRRGSPPSAHGLRQAVGSSSPRSCTAAAPPHVTCTAFAAAGFVAYTFVLVQYNFVANVIATAWQRLLGSACTPATPPPRHRHRPPSRLLRRPRTASALPRLRRSASRYRPGAFSASLSPTWHDTVLVPLYACSVLATPLRAFVPDASPCLASSDRRLVFIGLDNVFFGIDSYDCLDRVTDDSSCVLGFGKTIVCLRPGVRLVLAQLRPHLILDGSDCIDLGINILDDCPRRVSVIITMAPSSRMRLHVRLPRHRHLRPRHRPRRLLATATSTSSPPRALGSLDIGTRATTSPELSSASSPVQASAPRHRPRRSRYDCGGVSAFWVYFGLSPV